MKWKETDNCYKISSRTWCSGCLIKAVLLHNLHFRSYSSTILLIKPGLQLPLIFKVNFHCGILSNPIFWGGEEQWKNLLLFSSCISSDLAFYIFSTHTKKWLLDQGCFEKHYFKDIQPGVTGKGNELQGRFSTESPCSSFPLGKRGKKKNNKTTKRHLQRDFQLDETQAGKQERAVHKAPAWPQVMWPSANSLSVTDKSKDEMLWGGLSSKNWEGGKGFSTSLAAGICQIINNAASVLIVFFKDGENTE